MHRASHCLRAHARRVPVRSHPVVAWPVQAIPQPGVLARAVLRRQNRRCLWRCANNFPHHAHSACVRGMWQNTTTIHKPDPSEGPSATVIYRARQLVLLDEHLKRIIDEFMR